MKRILALILALAMMLGLTACGGGSGNDGVFGSGDVTLEFTVSDYGFGTSWLRNAVTRFCEEYADYDFGGGKIGVKGKVVLTEEGTEAMPTSGNDIYFLQNQGLETITMSTNTLDLNDIITTKLYDDDTKSIEDKLYPEDRERYKGNDGHYRALPTHENTQGLTYDRKLFETNGYFIAKPEAVDVVPHTFEKIEEILPYVNFVDVEVDGWEENLSVGPDGIEGTLDDGLPSSLMEYFTLCDYMAQSSVYPLACSGKYTWYMHCTIEGLMNNFIGGEDLVGFYDFTMDDLDVVVNFLIDESNPTGSNPFYGLDYIQKPNYKKVDLTEETGFYTTWSAAKYWAFAWAEVMVREGWIAEGGHPTVKPKNHIDTQAAFINGGYNSVSGPADEIAMLTEGTYWYNESRERGNITNFNRLNPEVGEQDLRPMPLPSNIFTSVTGEEGTETVAGLTESTKGKQGAYITMQTVYMCANARVQEDPALLNATLKFFEFFHTDEELQRATATAGFKKMFQYKMDNAETSQGWESYYKSLYEYTTEDAYVLRRDPSTNTGLTLLDYFSRGQQLVFKENGTVGGTTYGNYLYASEADAAYKYHESGMISAENWKLKFYKGNNPSAVRDADGVHYITRGL